MRRRIFFCYALWALTMNPILAQEFSSDHQLAALLKVYATAPQGYPEGPEFARPDASVPFRWHFYHDRAIAPATDMRILAHVDPFNPLEGSGVALDKDGGVKWQFVDEHATEGKQSLRATFTAGGKGAIRILPTAGLPSFSSYLKARGMLATASCYGPHYRWIKLDAFNPTEKKIAVRIQRVPFVLHPGKNIVAVKMADAVDRGYGCDIRHLVVTVVDAKEDVTLFFDNVRVEQEKPAMLSEHGWMFQFPGRADAKDPPVLSPGFTAVDAETIYTPERKHGWTGPMIKRRNGGHSFRSFEHGLLWGHCTGADASFRVDVGRIGKPSHLGAGRFGVAVFGAPGSGFQWDMGLSIKINGRAHEVLAPRSAQEVRRVALAGEAWDFRPGSCVWDELVREPYYPRMQPVFEQAEDGRLEIEFPAHLSLHALFVFPEKHREEAVRDLQRLNYLLAESWDVSHPWIRASYAAKTGDGKPYMGLHNEMQHPETIPGRLQALKLAAADFQRGFVLFERGLTEPIYPDTIPTPDELATKLKCFAVPGQRECVTLGVLPLKTVAGLQIVVDDLQGPGKAVLGRQLLDVRVSRFHQKTMQFGHHNHDYNVMEQYLVRRPKVNLFPAAARRAYIDIHVPLGTPPGRYEGGVVFTGPDGKELARVPLALEVLPLRLEEPPVLFASSLADARLKDYGFNAFRTTYDDAVKQGYKGYLANCGYGPTMFKGQGVGWAQFADNSALLNPILEAGQKGKGPRGFFGGPVPGTHVNPKAESITQEFFAKLCERFPLLELPGRTMPVFYHGGYGGLQTPHEWIILAGPPQKSTPAALDAAGKAGKDFWFIDGLRHEKEHAGRFTFGFWLWRLGATGRYTTLEAALQYGGGTARHTYSWEPYYTLLDVTTCNVDRALKESLQEGRVNPSRDLILLRAGIDDYRYLHTFDMLIDRTQKTHPDSPALVAAKKYRTSLWDEISLDLPKYYEARAGAYGENWFVRPGNPWTSAKFAAARRQLAEYIGALAQNAKS